MTIYFLQLSTIFILWPLQRTRLRLGKSFCGKNVYLWLVFLFLFLVMALRDVSVGSDTLGYTWVNSGIERAPDYATALVWSSIPSAYAYVGIHYIISRIIYSDQIGIIINSATVCVSFYYYIKYNSRNYGLSLFLFIALCLYFESMNGCRQFMAIGIALNAYEYLKLSLKSKRGWLLLAIATGVHNTILLFVVIALFGVLIKSEMNDFQKTLCTSIVISLIVATGFVVLVDIFVSFFPYFIIYLDGTNNAQLLQNVGNGRIILLYIVLCAFIILVNYYLKINHSIISTSYNVDLFMCFVCVILGGFFSKNILFARAIWPFECLFIVYLANCLSIIKSHQKVIMYSMLFLGLGIYCIMFLLEDKSHIIPYMTFYSY